MLVIKRRNTATRITASELNKSVCFDVRFLWPVEDSIYNLELGLRHDVGFVECYNNRPTVISIQYMCTIYI